MNTNELLSPTSSPNYMCPDLRANWKLARVRGQNQIILQEIAGERQFSFNLIQGFALQYFTGELTVEQLQKLCVQQFGDRVPDDLVEQLWRSLITLGIISTSPTEQLPQNQTNSPQFKACVEWIYNPDGHWILRNLEDYTFMQISDVDKAIIEQIGKLPTAQICQEFGTTPQALRHLLQMLAGTGMLVGTKPSKRPQGKFNPLQLLYFKISLFNPDPFLNRNINKLRWIWTPVFGYFLGFFLSYIAVMGYAQHLEIFYIG